MWTDVCCLTDTSKLCVRAASGRAGELAATGGWHVHVDEAGGRREGC